MASARVLAQEAQSESDHFAALQFFVDIWRGHHAPASEIALFDCALSSLSVAEAAIIGRPGYGIGRSIPPKKINSNLALVEIHLSIIQKDERSRNAPDYVLTQQGETRRSDSQRQRPAPEGARG